ncbi:phage head-tail connector protein [Clostridium neuense]|uniref:Phage head-tail connector protein n=1 Tax=Clostridium neuense TaxID=1728934 RepID=A0ABW8TIU0_9CLOT
MVIDDVKELKGWQDNSHDGKINIYIRRAVTLIGNYLNLGSNNGIDIENTYQDACIAYVMEQFDRKGNEATKQYSQGSRSGTYENSLSDNVKNLLPVPYARMMG